MLNLLKSELKVLGKIVDTYEAKPKTKQYMDLCSHRDNKNIFIFLGFFKKREQTEILEILTKVMEFQTTQM